MKFRMNVHHVLFFCFLSGALCPTETYSGDFPLYTATEGQSISFEFPFTLARGSKNYLCKGECKKKNILIKTPHATAQHGRYSIKYHEGVLQVTITELQTSDSGWYRCGVGNLSLSDSYELVEIRVKEGALCPTETYSGDFPLYTATEGQSISFEFPFTLARGSKNYLCKGECKKKNILIKTPHATAQHGRYSIKYHEGVLQVTITELQTSDSGWYRCGVGNLSLSDSYELVEIRVKEVSHSVSPLVVIVCATVVGFVLLAVFLLLLYKWKSKRETDGFNIRGNSDNTNMEFVTYENCPPLSTCEDSTYQALDPASRDQDQIYFTLTQDV